MQPDVSSQTTYRALFLGPSALWWQETPTTTSLLQGIEDNLRGELGDSVTCIAERVFFGPRMAQRTEEMLVRHDPQAVLLFLGSGPFEFASVVEAIGHRWPRLYGPALKVAEVTKELGGGGLEGVEGARGLLFRIPRHLGSMLVGMDTTVSIDEAIRTSIESIDALARHETIPTLVYYSAVCWPPSFFRALALVSEFDREVRQHCRQRRVGYWFRQEEMAKRGFEPHVGRDGIHADAATYAFDAKLISDLMVSALQGHK